MAYSQQAWNDVLGLIERLKALDNEVGSMLKTDLNSLKSLYDSIAADSGRTLEDVALADTHPVFNANKISTEVGRFLALRDYLAANGYIV